MGEELPFEMEQNSPKKKIEKQKAVIEIVCDMVAEPTPVECE